MRRDAAFDVKTRHFLIPSAGLRCHVRENKGRKGESKKEKAKDREQEEINTEVSLQKVEDRKGKK